MPLYASKKNALGFCDRCGFQYPLKELKSETVNMASTNILVCPECWDPDQPQRQLGRISFADVQAIDNPRPLGESGGREDGWLVFNYDNMDDWDGGVNGSLYRNPENKTWIWDVSNADATGPQIGSDRLAINAALYRRMRIRFRVLEWPSSWKLSGYVGVNTSSEYYFSRVYSFDNRPPKEQFRELGNQIHDWYWDFSKKALPTSSEVLNQADYPWNEVIDRIRFGIFSTESPTSFKIEIFDISFIPVRVQPATKTQYGIVNYDFTAPEFNRGVSGSYTVQNLGIDAVPGWLATPSPIEPSPSGSAAGTGYIGNIGIADDGGPFTGVDWLGRRCYMSTNYVPNQISQLTGTKLESDTEYTVSADFYRKSGDAATKYCLRMFSDSTLLASSSNPIPGEGAGVTSTVSYTTTSSVPGEYLQVEVENSDNDPDAEPVSQVNFGNVRISSISGYVSKRWDMSSDEVDEFTAINGTVAHEGGKLVLTSTGEGDDNLGVRLVHSDLSGILAPNCMKMRIKCRVLKTPQATFYGELKFNRHWPGQQTVSPSAPDPGFSDNPGQWMIVEWDMVGGKIGWTQALSEFEWNIWQSGDSSSAFPATDSQGIVEIDWISLEKYPKDPDLEVKYGVTNWNFAVPKLWSPGLATYQHFGNTETAIPGWTCDESADPTGASADGNMGVIICASNDVAAFTPQCAFISAQDTTPLGFSQTLDEVVQANTRYWLQVDVGRRVIEDLPISYKNSIRANGVELVSSDTVYQEPKVVLEPTESATTTCTFRTHKTDASIGYPIEIRIENSSVDPDVNGAIVFDHVKFFSEPVQDVTPVVAYDFTDGTATETSGGNMYGIDGWAYWDSGTHPVSGSLTVPFVGVVQLNTGDDWDNPYFTYWDERSPGVKASVPTGETNFVRMEIKRTVEGSVASKEWKGRLYWVQQAREAEGLYPFAENVTVGEPNWSGDDDDMIVTWEVGSNPKWRQEGTATGFRIDLYEYTGAGTRDVFQVNYIWFLKDNQGF